jgi:chromosome segregation ATPase
LRENGRLPSANIDDYFEEIKEMNDSRNKIKQLKAIQEEKDAEISTLQDKFERIKVSEKKMRSLLEDLEKKLDDKLGSKIKKRHPKPYNLNKFLSV